MFSTLLSRVLLLLLISFVFLTFVDSRPQTFGVTNLTFGIQFLNYSSVKYYTI
jgi:hypothetical protein